MKGRAKELDETLDENANLRQIFQAILINTILFPSNFAVGRNDNK